MKLYAAKVPACAADIVKVLREAGDIEIGEMAEACKDLEAVLKESLRLDREITDKAKDMLEQKGLPHGQFGQLKRALAEKSGFALGEEGVSWLLNQLTETLMHSQFVDEVFAEDGALRKRMRPVLQKHMSLDEELDAEVRKRIKNLQEGTTQWDVEYQRVLEQLRKNRGAE